MENKYFAELARRLRAAGITTGHPEKNRLTVLLNDQPVLSVSAGSDVFLLPAGSNQPEASELYHKVAQTADEVYAYVDSALYLSQMDEIDRKLRELRKLRRRLLEAAGEDRQIHDTERMMEYLEDGPEWLDEVPAELFGELIERIIIISPERLKFRLLNGMELAENIERTVR